MEGEGLFKNQRLSKLAADLFTTQRTFNNLLKKTATLKVAVFFELVYDLVMLKKLRERDVKPGTGAIQGFHFYSSILVLSLVAFFFALIYWNLLEPRKDFFNELWAPAYLLVHGKSPYDTSSFNPISPAAWLPMSIGFFFPLGWLGDDIALRIWFISSLLELGWMIFWVQGKFKPPYISFITGLIVFSFPPTLYHLILGQFSIAAMICLILAVHFVLMERDWVAAFLLALALSKPHLGTLAMLGLSYYYFQRGGSRALLLFWMRVLAMILVLCIPLFIAYPNWIPDALISMKANPYWSYPSLFILFERYLGAWGLGIWMIVVLVVIWIGFMLWRKLPPMHAIYWSLGLAPLITPYVGSWDFVVVLPVFIFTFIQVNWMRRVFLIFSFLFAWYGMYLVQNMEPSHNHYFWWVPVWFMLSAALVTSWNKVDATPNTHQSTP